MRRLYVFRHGETDWNVQSRFQGHLDIPLNDEGKRQAGALAPVLLEQKVEAILSSDLSRALETASIIARALSIPVTADPGLREAHLGEAQGLTYNEVVARFGETALRWKSSHPSDADISYPGGETGAAVIQRTLAALHGFLIKNAYKRVGVSCHGGVIRRIMQYVLPPESAPVPIPNAVLYVLEYDLKKKSLVLLPSPLPTPLNDEES